MSKKLTEEDKQWLRDQSRKSIMDAREKAVLTQQRVEDADEVGRELHGEFFVDVMAYHGRLRPYRDECRQTRTSGRIARLYRGATMNDGATETESDDLQVEAVDVDEMIRRERIRSLFDARKRCREVRSDSKIEYDGQETDVGNMAYRTVLESYIREAEALFSQTEDGRRYWNERDFGTVTVPLPVEASSMNGTPYQVPGPGEEYPIGVLEQPDPKTVDMIGLKSLFETDSPITATFEFPSPHPGMGRGQTYETETIKKAIPYQILDKMFARTNGYLAELGIGIEIDETDKQTKIDDDLIREVEQWRRENL